MYTFLKENALKPIRCETQALPAVRGGPSDNFNISILNSKCLR